MNTVTNNIKTIIKAKGFKQKHIAEQLGLSEQNFSNILCGRKIFKTEYVNSVCRALEITPNELFDESNKN